MAKMTLEERIRRMISRSKDDVFLRGEFSKFGGYDQVGRALRTLVSQGFIVKGGYGIYVRARASSLSGNPVPVISLVEIGLEALKKMGIKADLGESSRRYRDGKTTQMPMATVIAVSDSRVSRKICFGKKEIRIER